MVALRPRLSAWTEAVQLPRLDENDETALEVLEDIVDLMETTAPQTDPATLPAPSLLSHFVQRWAQTYPDFIALDIPPPLDGSALERVSWTYGQLSAAAHTVAKQLILPRTTPGGVIALMMERENPWLYACQQAALRSGLPYVTLNSALPDDRKLFIMEDAGVSLVLAQTSLLLSLPSSLLPPDALIHLDQWLETNEIEAETPTGGDDLVPVSPDTLAYLIYTSGSTGKPKGVMVEHRSVVQLALSDREFFSKAGQTDRYALVSAHMYDSAINEMYLAFAQGGTLVVVADDVLHLGPDLAMWLRHERISFLCPTPTLLATLGDIPSPCLELPLLKFIYVGGEAISSGLVNQWAPGKMLVNGYGPTECTIVATRIVLQPGVPVTIGHAVAGSFAHVMNPEQPLGEPLGDGVEGELFVGGICVSRGYLNRPDLTAEKFITHSTLGRLYRTGDIVLRHGLGAAPQGLAGSLAYLGRADAQVKIRGHRVELGEIEAAIGKVPGVEVALCAVQGEGKAKQLVAFIVKKKGGGEVDPQQVVTQLKEQLPGHMVPAPTAIAFLDSLPTSMSGKADRKRLPTLTPVHTTHRSAYVFDEDSTADDIVTHLFQDVLAREELDPDADFFEYGGNSVLAAELVSKLRRHPKTASVAVRDLYKSPSIAGIITLLEQHATGLAPESHRGTAVRRPPPPAPIASVGQRVAVSLAQLGFLSVILMIFSILSYLVTFVVLPVTAARLTKWEFLGVWTLFLVVARPLFTILLIAMTVVAKWTLIGRYKPGVYPMYTWFYFRHWCVQRLLCLTPMRPLAGTELFLWVLRLLGAKIGRRVHIDRGVNILAGGWDLLEVGDHVSIGRDAALRMVDIQGRALHIGPIRVGARSTLETRAGMDSDSSLGENCVLTALSWLPAGVETEDNQTWDGVPAQHLPSAAGGDEADKEDRFPTVWWSLVAWPAIHSIATATAQAWMTSLQLLPLLASLLALMTWADYSPTELVAWLHGGTPLSWAMICVLTVGSVAGDVAALVIRAVGVRALGRVRPGVYSRYGWTWLQAWLKVYLVETAVTRLSGTLWWPTWLRAAGAKIGNNCEISTIMDVVPELTEIGDNVFFADGIYLGGGRNHHGRVELKGCRLAGDIFLGNHAIIPPGADLPRGVLLGVCTRAGLDATDADVTAGSSWFGIPHLRLPQREVVVMDKSLTHTPPWPVYLARLFFELLRFTVPLPFLFLFIGWARTVHPLHAWVASQPWLPRIVVTVPTWVWGGGPAAAGAGEGGVSIWAVLVVLPGWAIAAGVLMCVLVWLVKWGLLGKVVPGQHALWSCWSSRWDFMYVCWAAWAAPVIGHTLDGSPMLFLWLNSMGADVASDCVLGTNRFAQMVDPDMLHFGSGSTVTCLFQAHSFEDRVLKIGHVWVGEGASVAENTVLMYGSRVDAGACVAPHSVVMKNEHLPGDQFFVGSPCNPH